MTTFTETAPGLKLPSQRYVFGEECWSKVGGYQMRYLRAGTGPPLVLVHGLMGYSFSWRHNFEALSRHYTVYAIDLVGIGFSERPPESGLVLNLKSIAQRLLEWMRELKLEQAVLVGTSHGGGIAILMTDLDRKQGSDLIGELILVCSVNPWSRVGRRRTRFFGNRLVATCARRLRPMVLLVKHWALGRMYGDPAKVSAETRAGYDAPLAIPGTMDYLLGIVRFWKPDMDELKDVLERINDMRVLLLWGTKDSAVPLESAYELRKRLPRSELVVLDGVGHLPYEEAPTEFNRAILQYLGH